MNKFLSMSVEEKERVIEALQQEAMNCEMEVGGCARCTLFALQKHLGLCDQTKVEPMLRAANGLSGGLAGAGEACGALSGGVMAIALAYGPEGMTPSLVESEAKTMSMEATDRAYEYLTRFRNEFGSIYCRDIRTQLLDRPWQLRDPEYSLWASQKEIHDKCGEVTHKAAGIAARVIMEPLENIPRLFPPA